VIDCLYAAKREVSMLNRNISSPTWTPNRWTDLRGGLSDRQAARVRRYVLMVVILSALGCIYLWQVNVITDLRQKTWRMRAETAEIEGFTIRIPIPETYFIHKLIVAPRRRTVEKRDKDIDQCTVLIPILSDERLHQVMQAQRIANATKRSIAQSCDAIAFPLQRLFS